MTLTLLLDLDNTLLDNDMKVFIPAYLQGLSRCLASYAEPERVVESLLAATMRMIENDRPNRTLKETFDTHFYPSLGLDYHLLQEPIAAFYHHEHPKLRALTQARSQAVELIRSALARGYRIAIATNTLFPQTATYQRLEWAGFPPDKYPFEHITTYETSHFAKPNPAYYAEILAYLGWPDEPVIMVGDDLKQDIGGANQLGISTFWIRQNGNRVSANSAKPTASGSLAGVLPWIDSLDPDSLMPDYDTPSAIQATLRATPAALANLLPTTRSGRHRSEERWGFRPEPNEWNLNEVICHLRDVEAKVHLPRLQRVIEDENPFIAGVDTDSWVERYKYHLQDGKAALEAFVANRMQTLDLLSSTDETDWQRPGRHAIFGPTRFQELSHFMAEHDRLHLTQIKRLLR
ncbi:MAG: HAD-IA family hydrolase [Anaerolineales bacterium]